MISQSPIWVPADNTDLANAFERHLVSYRGQSSYALDGVELVWLNALRDRALRQLDPTLINLTERLLALLTNPGAYADFKAQFESTYETARRSTYPVSCAVIDGRHFYSGTTHDYTLSCIDLGQLRAIEDDALTDQSMKAFAQDMLRRLAGIETSPRHEIYRSVFDIYSEAVVCRLLRERCGANLNIKKIAETSQPGPDFECHLHTELNGQVQTLAFFIEVKALDIVHAPQRIPEMLDEGMGVQIEAARQLAEGCKVAIAEGEIAPHRGYGDDPDYDWRSVRKAIENLIRKAAGNFKERQFRRGPTIALANLIRLPTPGQGAGTLAPFYYDPELSGACVSGALWHMAFGEHGAPIHRPPEFEGDGTVDGRLECSGILVDSAVALKTPAFIALHYDQGAYRFDGFYDAQWESEDGSWNSIHTEAVLHALCGDYNDRANRRAHDYAHYRDRSV